MRLAHMYEMKDLVMICADSLKLSKPDENTPWTAKDVQKLASDLGNEGLKQFSNLWLASNAYQTLSCGDRGAVWPGWNGKMVWLVVMSVLALTL